MKMPMNTTTYYHLAPLAVAAAAVVVVDVVVDVVVGVVVDVVVVLGAPCHLLVIHRHLWKDII